MASKTLPTREDQKSRYSSLMESRANVLKEKGFDDKAISRDPFMKHYRARIKQIDGAVARIGFLEDQTRKLKELKEQRKAEAETARAAIIAGEVVGKKKKAAEEKPAASSKKAAAGKGAGKGKQDAKKKGK